MSSDSITDQFKFAKLNENATEPVKAHPYDAGFDLSACENAIIEPGSQKLINTGIAISIPTDCYARVAPRSGLAYKKCLHVQAGVIDHGYSDAVRVILYNLGKEPFEIKCGDRIAQLIFEKIYTPTKITLVTYQEIVDSNNGTRGLGGFGSTGISA